MRGDLFEDVAFSKLATSCCRRSRVAFNESTRFELEVEKNILNFDRVLQADPKAKVFMIATGSYRVSFSKDHMALSLADLMLYDNDVSLDFSDSFQEYSPDDVLIKKSNVPLWILKSEGNNVVYINRVW